MRVFGLLALLGLVAYSTVASANLGSDYLTALASGSHAPTVVSRVTAAGVMTAATNYLAQSTSTVTSTRVRRLNAGGSVVWTVDMTNNGAIKDLELAPNGDVYLLTWSQSNSILTHISNSGQILWKKVFGAERRWRDLAVVGTGGFGYALLGVGDLQGYFYPTQFAVARFNPTSGTPLWEQSPGVGAYNPRPRRVEPVGQGVYIAADATLYNSSTSTQLVVAGYDLDGNRNFLRLHPSPGGVALEVKDLATSTDGQFYVGARVGGKQGVYRIVQTGTIDYLNQINSTLPLTNVEPTPEGGVLALIGRVNTQAGNVWSQWKLYHYLNTGALAASYSWSRTGLPLQEFVAINQDPGGRTWVAGRDGQYGFVRRIGPTGEGVYEEVGSGEASYGVQFASMHFDRYQNLYLTSIWKRPGGFDSRGQRASNLDGITPYQTSLVSGQRKTATIRLRWAAPDNSFRNIVLAKVNPTAPLTLPASVVATPGALTAGFTMIAGAVKSRTLVPFTATYGGKTINAVAVIDP
jgi:hypothetical protein